MLVHIEQVVKDYLIKEMGGNPKTSTHDLFAVEGGTAAMCYIFDSLKQNHLLKPKDKIALFVPIFTPYVEIANLPSNEFEVIMIHASEVNEAGVPTWQYPKEELDKLKDTSIKLACIVNPSNPPAVAMSEESMTYLKDIVDTYHPKLMIVTDDVYGTFCDGFKSLMVTMPYHTLGVYSYSKYFGVTGWRLGVIALAKENVYNELISQLPAEKKAILQRRYEALTTTPHQIPFIDRIVADSRDVALNHTAGLSTPQQVQMAIFSVFALLDVQNKYKEQTKIKSCYLCGCNFCCDFCICIKGITKICFNSFFKPINVFHTVIWVLLIMNVKKFVPIFFVFDHVGICILKRNKKLIFSCIKYQGFN